MNYGLLARLTVIKGEARSRDPEFVSEATFSGDKRVVGDITIKVGDSPIQLGEFSFFAFISNSPIKFRLRTTGFEEKASHFSIGVEDGSKVRPELSYLNPGADEDCLVQYVGIL